MAPEKTPRGSILSLVAVPFVVLSLLAGGGFAVWKVGLERLFVAKRWGVVEAGCIYRSGQLSEYMVKPTY